MLVNVQTWGDLFKEYGLPLAFLAVVLFFVWKFGVPLVQKLLETQSQQLTESRLAREIERKDFLAALDKVVTKHEVVTTRLADSMDGIREEIRRSRG